LTDMDNLWKEATWRQFGAAIDMFANPLRACPDELWKDCLWQVAPEWRESAEFWYVAYHALFWLDLYLSGTEEGFHPPEPFTLAESDPAGRLPERTYTREELLTYLAHCRAKCQSVIESLDDESAARLCTFPGRQLSFAELLLYNMRHMQEHGAQMSMFLGQRIGATAKWVSKAKEA
jgi:hypothetical protein